MERNPNKFWNPYLAGVALGLVLATTFLVMGAGLGASGGSLRAGVAALSVVAPGHVAATPPLARAVVAEHPNWLVFELFGVILGGFVAAYTTFRAASMVGDDQIPAPDGPHRVVPLALVPIGLASAGIV